jgi:L-rhamnose mutarotase
MAQIKRYCLALDLKDDQEMIAEYENWHKPVNAWKEITDSIMDAGVVSMQIYRVFNRLFMIMEVDHTFSFERKKEMDLANEKVRIWEDIMNRYQQLLPGTAPGAKWVLMDKIYDLDMLTSE